MALTSKEQLFIDAPPEIVWNIHTDIPRWSEWQPDIKSASLEGPLAVGSEFKWKPGIAITSRIEKLRDGHSIEWSGSSVGTVARHSWSFAAQDNGTLITTEESMCGWLVAIMKLVTPGFLDRSLDVWLKALKARAEAMAQRPRCR